MSLRKGTAEKLDKIQILEDWMTEIIDDSFGPDWTARDASRHLILNFQDDLDKLSPLFPNKWEPFWDNPDGPGAA